MTSPREELMANQTRDTWLRTVTALAVLTAIAVVCVCVGRAVLPWDKMFPDYICYFAAGKILASGQSPYDIPLQIDIQHQYGWEKAGAGFGVYDFLPYFYPPWFAFGWVLLVPLGFEGGKIAWFFINIESALITGYLLTKMIKGVSHAIVLVTVPVFAFSFACILLGQTALI